MRLLSIPPEMILDIVDYLDWPSFLSFLTTSEQIFSIFTQETILRLRTGFKSRLHASETALREKLNIAYAPSLQQNFWSSHPDPYSEPGSKILPCYTCHTFQPKRMFSTAKSVGPYAIGQRLSDQRICLECGVWTGFYPRGCRMTSGLGVCEGCGDTMDVLNGKRFALSEKTWGTIPQSYSKRDEGADKLAVQSEGFQKWWNLYRRRFVEADTDISGLFRVARYRPNAHAAPSAGSGHTREKDSDSEWFEHAHELKTTKDEQRAEHPALKLMGEYWWDRCRRCHDCVRGEEPEKLAHDMRTRWREKMIRRYTTKMNDAKKQRVEMGKRRRDELEVSDQNDDTFMRDTVGAPSSDYFPRSFPKYSPLYPEIFQYKDPD